MKKQKRLLAALIAPALLATSGITSNAAVIEYDAILSGPAESPANASPGTGLATVFLDTTLNTMQVNITFSGLVGTTTASHIHAATAVAGTGTAGVATQTPSFVGFPLGVTSGSYSSSVFDLTLASSWNAAFITANGGTTAGAEAALIAALASDKAYLNIHTSAFPGGEIRGFLTPSVVPEPSTLALLGLGGLVFARAARRR